MVANSNQQTSKLEAFLSSNFAIKAKSFLNSNISLALISLIVVLFWALNFAYVSTVILFCYLVCVFIFCHDNPKGLLFPVLSIFYMSPDTNKHALFMGIFGGIMFAIIVAYCLIKIYKTKEVNPKKGKMFWAFMLYIIANCLAGIIGYFNILNVVIAFLFCVFAYAFYWFCINFIKDYKTFFAKCLIFLSLIITLQLLINYLRADDFMYMLEHKLIRIGTGEINNAALFVVCGVCSCFYLAQKHKFDYLFILLALFFDLIIFFTYSRIALLVCAIITVVYFFITLKNSQNKKIILIGLGCSLAIVLVFCVVFFNKIYDIISYYLRVGFGGNGRASLWSWAWDEFKNNPVFGIGFITRNQTVIETFDAGGGLIDFGGFAIVTPHNSLLHYLTCTGIIGLILHLPFIIKKYIIACKNLTSFNLFCLINYFVFLVCGMFDSYPTTNIFNILVLVMFMAFSENEEKKKSISLEKDKIIEQDNTETKLKKDKV